MQWDLEKAGRNYENKQEIWITKFSSKFFFNLELIILGSCRKKKKEEERSPLQKKRIRITPSDLS